MSKISKETLNKYLWGSAEFLRTNIDAGEYKQYIFPLLFFKRMSDVYDEEEARAREKYGDDFDDYDEDEIHSFIVPKGFHWNDVRNKPSDIGQALVEAFQKIEEANPQMLSGAFGSGAWTNKNKLPDRLLKDLMEHFSSLSLTIENCPEDELGEGYEYLIRQFADDSGHTAQEFYTNRTVVHLMTEILKPNPGESIYDPTCGTAGMLISCIAYLKAHNLEWRNAKLYGQEITPLTASISSINCILHGIKDFNIVSGDTLETPAFIENDKLKTFSLCLANPPYSIKDWNRELFSEDKYGRSFLGIPPQGRADYAFIQHILKSMDPNCGRCAILLPHGVLVRKDERHIREKLVNADLVEGIIGIGKGLFYNSPMEACIMICKTNKDANHKGKIFFINGKHEVARENAQSFLKDEHIRKIAKTYENCEIVDGFSAIASIDEIRNNDYSLSVNRYVRNNKTIEYEPPEIIASEWFDKAQNLKEALSSLSEYIRRSEDE